MKNIIDELAKHPGKGEQVNEDQASMLKEHLNHLEVVNDWCFLITNNKLVGIHLSLDERNDESGFGVELQIMTPSQTIEESLELYPGISAVKEGFLPIGMCMSGSGDPYFIKKEKDEIKLYRILHDSITENDELDTSSVELISDFSRFLARSRWL
ncbi:MAG: hypothetical protein QE487_04310 [Fluviicola sp.]|nr:hypothetical protein [Fluviicola sp.]